MACNLLRFPLHKTTHFSNLSPSPPPLPRPLFPSFQQKTQPNFRFSHQNLIHKSNPPPSLSTHSSLPSTSYNPPTTKEEAILQARTCLSTTLQKPLNNPRLSSGKLKKQKQPRLRVEIPVSNGSNESLAQLALDIFQDLPIRRKHSSINLLIFWGTPILSDLAKSYSSTQTVQNIDISSASNTDQSCNGLLNSADVSVFLAPEKTELELIKRISEGVYPKPVVIFNPKWGFEEENGFGELLSSFVGSFEVVYSFMGIEVRGLLSRKKAVVFRNAKDGVLSGEKWLVLVEEGGGEEEEGKLKVVTKYKKRPTITEIENVLYNLMAVNSPVTKSVKLFRDLVSKAKQGGKDEMKK